MHVSHFVHKYKLKKVAKLTTFYDISNTELLQLVRIVFCFLVKLVLQVQPVKQSDETSEKDSNVQRFCQPKVTVQNLECPLQKVTDSPKQV